MLTLKKPSSVSFEELHPAMGVRYGPPRVMV